MRVILTVVALVFAAFAAGCAQGIVHSLDAVESSDVTVPSGVDAGATVEAGDAREEVVEKASTDVAPTSCEATKTDEACFDCCDATYPKAIDIWFDALEACCPNDECEDAEYEKCELAADDLCAKTPECAGLEACEDVSGCWEKVSSEP